MTKYSKQILDTISASREHPSAEQLYMALKDSGSDISMASVYNNLGRLAQAGEIRRISLAGQPDRYDRTERHDHLVCSRCGRIMDLELPDLTEYISRELGMEISAYDLKVSCLCPDCREAQKKI